jgi:methionine-rich copper-binding protein CopC
MAMRRIIFWLGLLSLLAFTSNSWAHAFLDHAEPAVGSTLTSAPTIVKIWFTEPLEAGLSKIQVYDEKNREVDRRDTKIDPVNKAVLMVSLPPLESGKFRVIWHAVSVDSHTTNGAFAFVLSP